MIKQSYRTEGRYKGCYGTKDIYRFYRKIYGREGVKYKEFVAIIKECNKELVRVLTEEAACVKLPYRLGELQIVKFERGFIKLKVDWGRSVKEGMLLYFEDKYRYKYIWRKHYAIVKNKTKYKFIPARGTCRKVAPLLRTKKYDYFKY